MPAASPTNGYEVAIRDLLKCISGTFKCQAMREEQSVQNNWRDRMEAGQLVAPFAVLSVGTMSRASQSGAADSNLFALNATITYVIAQTAGGDQTNDLMGDLVNLWGAIYRYNNSNLWSLEEDGTSFDTSPQSAAMGALAKAMSPLIAGELSVRLLVDITPGRTA